MAPDFYYYAGGKRIPLELDREHVAVDLSEAESREGKRPDPATVEGAEELRSGLFLVEKSALSADARQRLDQEDALLPVYLYEDALVVILPEVRVEIAAGGETEVHRFLEQAEVPNQILTDRGTRLVVRPDSGRGEDALRLANELQESVPVEMAQARFLRRVPKRGRTP
ncbi:MAG: hypothetical protein WBG96_12375 [Thermoanaerobaculia bacterium]